jgi:hypothetical protein
LVNNGVSANGSYQHDGKHPKASASERGRDLSEKDCEAIVSAVFDGATKLGRLTKGPAEYREGRVDQPKAKK